MVPAADRSIKGLYSGDFGGSPIYININYAQGKYVAGYNTHKGLRRNLSGEIKQEGDQWQVTLHEPGDHQFDGIFSIRFNKDFSEGKGSWKPVNAGATSEKTFILEPSRNESELGYFTADHADIFFAADGSCMLQYYPKSGDTAFAPQMEIVRGTYLLKDSTIEVSWQAHTQFGKRNSVFKMEPLKDKDGTPLDFINITGEGFNFFSAL